MITDLLEINDFVVLIDQTDAKEAESLQCQFDTNTLGVSFYGSGHVDIKVQHGEKKLLYTSKKGMAFSYVGDHTVKFSHNILQSEPLRSVSIFSSTQHIEKLPWYEKDLFTKHLGELWLNLKSFEMGPQVLMSSEMHSAIAKIFSCTLENSERQLFMKSQVLELLSHYFAQIDSQQKPVDLNQEEINQMYQAESIMVQNMHEPPSIAELSRLIGTNSNKLKRNFKQIFGLPVFKYLQNQRLLKAYKLLEEKELSVQEVSHSVGYESLSSFSNAFYKQFGFRPSEVVK